MAPKKKSSDETVGMVVVCGNKLGRWWLDKHTGHVYTGSGGSKLLVCTAKGLVWPKAVGVDGRPDASRFKKTFIEAERMMKEETKYSGRKDCKCRPSATTASPEAERFHTHIVIPRFIYQLTLFRWNLRLRAVGRLAESDEVDADSVLEEAYRVWPFVFPLTGPQVRSEFYRNLADFIVACKAEPDTKKKLVEEQTRAKHDKLLEFLTTDQIYWEPAEIMPKGE